MWNPQQKPSVMERAGREARHAHIGTTIPRQPVSLPEPSRKLPGERKFVRGVLYFFLASMPNTIKEF